MSTRQKVFSVLFGGARPWDVVFNLFILVLVLLNVSFLVASSVEEVAAANATLFFVAEAISVGIFTVEYLLRLWTCVEKLKLGRLGPVLGRLRFMVTFAAVVDFISIVPFYVFLIVNASGNSASGAQFFSAVRILRIFRLLKLDRLTKAFKLLKLAIFRTAEILFVTLLMELILFLFVATLLWILEPKLFPSIPSAMFVGLLMLTGSDFPPEDQLSVVSRVFVAITVFISILVFALPTGALASGFDQVSSNYVATKKKKPKGELNNIAVEDSDDELLAEEAEASATKENNDIPPAVKSLNQDRCPTCGK